ELRAREPGDPLVLVAQVRGLAAPLRHVEEEALLEVAERRAGDELDAELLGELARERLARRLAALAVAAEDVPPSREARAVRGAQAEQDPAVADQHASRGHARGALHAEVGRVLADDREAEPPVELSRGILLEHAQPHGQAERYAARDHLAH